MSGHSHWSKIKRAKATTDDRRGRVWSKLARRVIVAAKGGGGNPDENLTLRYAIDECRAANMPRDTIENAIKKGTGELGAIEYERIMYEGFGPGGVAILVDALTDNRSRTAPEMRNIFERAGGQMGGAGSVGWMFTQLGTFMVPVSAIEEDALIELCLDAGADDVKKTGDSFEITCPPNLYAQVRDALAAKNIAVESSQVAMVPNNTVPIGRDKVQQLMGLLDALDDYEDVQNVYANYEIPDDVAATLK